MPVKRKKRPLQRGMPLTRCASMVKRLIPVLALVALVTGCSTTFTNLTPQTQIRNGNNLYPVEVALTSRQQTMKWDTVVPQIIVGEEVYPMRPTPLMTNRWEGLVPVAPGKDAVYYKYKFDFEYNKIGKPGIDSATSPQYMLRILE